MISMEAIIFNKVTEDSIWLTAAIPTVTCAFDIIRSYHVIIMKM